MGWVIVSRNPKKETGIQYVRDRVRGRHGYVYTHTTSSAKAKTFFNKETAEEWRLDCEPETSVLQDISTMGKYNSQLTLKIKLT